MFDNVMFYIEIEIELVDTSNLNLSSAPAHSLFEFISQNIESV